MRPRTDKDQGFVEQLRTEFEVGRRGRHPGLRGEVELQLRRTLLGTVAPRLETVLHLLNRRAERSTAARVLVA